jgi:hypothetical protein
MQLACLIKLQPPLTLWNEDELLCYGISDVGTSTCIQHDQLRLPILSSVTLVMTGTELMVS